MHLNHHTPQKSDTHSASKIAEKLMLERERERDGEIARVMMLWSPQTERRLGGISAVL